MNKANFHWPLRVYYEDTDAGGVVYYANYLRFMERARTEALRGLGFDQGVLAQETGLAFVVRSVQVEYLRSAKLDDGLVIVSHIKELGRAQMVFAQKVMRGEEVLVEGTVRVACVDLSRGRPAATPKPIYEKLKAFV